MKIGVLLLNNDPNYRGGVNSYINGLFEGIKKVDTTNNYYFLVYERNKNSYKDKLSKNIHIKTFPDEKKWLLKSKILTFFTAPVLRFFYQFVEFLLYLPLIREINSLGLDVLYSPSAPYFPLSLKGKLVVSPHDIQYLHYPENFSLVDRWYRYATFPPMMRVSTVVQASTEFMKKDFNKMMDVPLEKIAVVFEGVMKDFLNFKTKKRENSKFLEKYNLKPGYLFYPAQHWPHKNHITLVKAVKYLREKYNLKFDVVLTGTKHSRLDSLYNFVERNKLESNIKYIGNIPFSELFYAYKNSLAVVIPVVYESSSLPVKEAMALGVPVIASKNGSNEEINMNENILLFKTYDYKDLAENIRKLYKNPKLRSELVRKSKLVIKEFSWDKIAKQFVSVFAQAYHDRIGSVFFRPGWAMNFDKLYEKGDHWFEEKQTKRFKLATKYLTGREKDILDIGCGRGVLFDFVSSKAKLVGVDVSKEVIKTAKRRNPKAIFKVGSADKLPFRTSSFDFIFCLEVLYYLKDDTVAFDEIKRVLKPGGRAVIGLTLGGDYYDYNSVMNKIRSRFKVVNEDFVLPLHVLPKFTYKWKPMSLFFYKHLPKGSEVKVYVYVRNP